MTGCMWSAGCILCSRPADRMHVVSRLYIVQQACWQDACCQQAVYCAAGLLHNFSTWQHHAVKCSLANPHYFLSLCTDKQNIKPCSHTVQLSVLTNDRSWFISMCPQGQVHRCKEELSSKEQMLSAAREKERRLTSECNKLQHDLRNVQDKVSLSLLLSSASGAHRTGIT
jgi:hypothetical protein